MSNNNCLNICCFQFRMLVYECIDNGNLDRWLHGDVGPVSPLTWDIRIKIAIGTAKGLVSLTNLRVIIMSNTLHDYSVTEVRA